MIPLAKLEEVNEAILQQLIDDAFRESRTLDFKAQLDLTRDGRQALAEDVCAFANTVGGDLVFGIREDGGIAEEIVPLHIADLDAQLLTLTNFLRDAVEPRVTTNLLSHAVPLAAGGHVVVLRVAPSPNAPHRLLRNNHFYLRNSVGKETMDIHAIRTAFAFSEGLADRAVAFRDRRLGLLRSRQIQVPLVPDQPMLVVHLVPVLSLTRREGHTIEELKAAAEDLQRAQPAANPLGRPVANFEGVICTSNTDRQDQHYGFAQLFRDGCIELVSVLTTEEQGNPPLPTIFPATYEPSLVQHALPVAFQALTTLGIPAPLYLSVSLLNVRGLRVAIRRPRTGLAGFPELPANLVDLTSSLRYVEDPAVSPAVLAGPAIDVVWNAVGIDHSQIVIWNPAPRATSKPPDLCEKHNRPRSGDFARRRRYPSAESSVQNEDATSRWRLAWSEKSTVGYDSDSAVRRVRTRTFARYVSRAVFSVSAPLSAAASVRWRIMATPRFCSAITFGRSLLDAFKAIKSSFVRRRPGHAAKRYPKFATFEFPSEPII
ncbi:ATP-binding protein [Burkholderia cenocepacia]|uniref:AlbA family DNA-binding domain-containing protein n=1 Tax=Burkholderia cenocepacia TaxID=95486 RepID=UPI001B9F9D62|nr:ATP-binding protein [Burkholderia cenocepacia]MBR8093756.1 ATP-binding protein [Burkholderia cenocepacia]